MTLYTIDADGNTPFEHAALHAAASDAAATEMLGPKDPDLNEMEIVGWVESDGFRDYWVKTYQQPALDEDGFTEFDGILCRVQRPGTHPGGNCWWLTPAETVMVPVWWRS